MKLNKETKIGNMSLKNAIFIFQNTYIVKLQNDSKDVSNHPLLFTFNMIVKCCFSFGQRKPSRLSAVCKRIGV